MANCALMGTFFFQRDRGRQARSVGIYFWEELSVFSAHVPNTPSSVKLELLFVELDLRNVKFFMGCLYSPPSATVEYWDLLEETLEAVLSSNKETGSFLTGDFNVGILDNAHPQPRNLEYFQSLFNLKNYVDVPTPYAKTRIRSSCIDLVLTEEDISDEQSVITSCTQSQPLYKQTTNLFELCPWV